MYVVFLQDNECHKDLMFSTENFKTATSFCHNFNTQLKELSDIYYKEYCLNRKSLNDKWFYESGFNAKLQSLTDKLQISVKIDFDEVECAVKFGYHFEYEEVKKL